MSGKAKSERGPFVAYAAALGVGGLALAMIGTEIDTDLARSHLLPVADAALREARSRFLFAAARGTPRSAEAT